MTWMESSAKDVQKEIAENNARAVYLSEELEFLDGMLEYDLPADAVTDVQERIALLRTVLSPDTAAGPDDGAQEGASKPR